ncbi:MAG: hypothetical protein LBK74_10875, partial [Treponema sp.]|nr:hypothetical protein [Treponema sp.]
APLGRKTGGAGDLFPRIRKDFKEKSSIPRCLRRGFFIKMAVEYMEKNEIENTRGINFDINIFRFLMQEAVKKINAMSTGFEQYNNMQLVKLDFLRRLGLFDESKILSEDIKNNEIIYQGIAVDIIEYQTELIKNQDIDEHYLEEIKKE